jgi:hypothetical protein
MIALLDLRNLSAGSQMNLEASPGALPPHAKAGNRSLWLQRQISPPFDEHAEGRADTG